MAAKTSGRILDVFNAQTIEDIAEFDYHHSDPNEAARLKEMDDERQAGKAAVAAEQAKHSEYVNAQYQAYIKTPEGAAWLAKINSKQTYKGHRKQTMAQQIANQLRQ